MVGHPKHVARALEAGVDLICAQGGEGGGHTGDVPSSILIPACVVSLSATISYSANHNLYASNPVGRSQGPQVLA